MAVPHRGVGLGGHMRRTVISSAFFLVLIALLAVAVGAVAALAPSGIAGSPAVAAAATPKITKIKPDTASAGTGANITITGSGFGSHQGKAGVRFTWKPSAKGNARYIYGTVIEWWDARIVCQVPVDDRGYPRAASSGKVSVVTSKGAVSRSRGFDVTFAYWISHQQPVCKYVVLTDNEGWRNIVRAAAQTWTATGQFTFEYSADAPADPRPGDGINEVYWADLGANRTLAHTVPQTLGPSGPILETDIVFNSRYSWGSLIPTKYDVQTIALHEMGHVAGLRDLYGARDKSKVMYGFADSLGPQSGWSWGRHRKLSLQDVAGVKWERQLYGSEGEVPITCRGNQIVPAISGDTVVWEENFSNGDNAIQGVNLATAEGFVARKQSSDWAWSPDVSGSVVVWDDGRNGDGSIYSMDLKTGAEFPICTVPGGQAFPAISGNIVVWQDDRVIDDRDIWGYDLSTGSEFNVCADAGNQYEPDVDGQIVVWDDEYWGIGERDIYGMDLATGEEFAICTESGQRSGPRIAGQIVVWVDSRWGDFDIVGKNLATGEEFPVCTAAGDQVEPQISGNIVIWRDERSGSDDIRGLDLSTGAEFTVCSAQGDQWGPALSGRTAVWRDERAGFAHIYGKRF